MKLDLKQETSYNLTLNLEILKHYHVDAELMHKWQNKRNNESEAQKVDLTSYPFVSTYWLNDVNVDEEIELLFNETKFCRAITIDEKIELKNSLMFFCFELEKDLLNKIFNDEDYLQLITIGNKIISIQSKKLTEITVNRIAINDRKIASEIVSLTCNLLRDKFVKCAKYTRYKNLYTIDDIIEFTETFKLSNETIHLEILGYWALLIQTYLHNQQLLVSKDDTAMNINRRTEFPLTTAQSDFIYTLMDIFNHLTLRKREFVNANAFIRKCIEKCNALNSQSNDKLK